MSDYVNYRRDDLHPAAVSYLSRQGWRAFSRGAFGELWILGQNDNVRIAVPRYLEANTRDFDALTFSLAQREQRAATLIADEIESEFLDIQAYRISDSFIIEDRVLLDSAATVLDSARKLLRAAATTARKPKSYIGSAFSRPADEIAQKARLSHTRHGSFVLPVVMPVDPPEKLANSILGEDGEVILESAERRTTRTLASALAALDSLAVRPDKVPSTDELAQLIDIGVSKEFVSAVRAIAVDAGVHAFETTFEWAPGIGTPPNIPRTIKIPEEAGRTLLAVENQLKATKPSPYESVSGQIVQVRQVPGEPHGEVTIRAVRGSRIAEVHITTSIATTRDATDWFKAGRALLAHGAILARPGRPLSMPEPRSIAPLDQIFLDAFTQGVAPDGGD
jgi:hypothetical protein